MKTFKPYQMVGEVSTFLASGAGGPMAAFLLEKALPSCCKQSPGPMERHPLR